MNIEPEHMKVLLPLAKPLIQEVVQTFISPKLAKLDRWISKIRKEKTVIYNHFEVTFEEYLLRTYEKCSIVNTLVFPNQQINLEEIYLPLTISARRNRIPVKINDLKVGLLSTYQKILISDAAGMGKTTLLKWICLQAIKKNLSVPIFVELRKLNNDHSILDEVFKQIDPVDQEFDKDLILEVIEMGYSLFLFDGYDEIPNEQRDAVTKDLIEFIDKTSRNWFIMTSRPESALTLFGNFQLFNISELNYNEAKRLIKTYDRRSKIKHANRLISDIESKHAQVKEFLVNPFLTSLLYKTYTYNKNLPSKKSTFYEEIYTCLYKHHDLSKDGYQRVKKSTLDIYDFRLVLRQLAWDTIKLGKVAYTEPQLLEYIKEVKDKCLGLEFKEPAFLEDLLLSVPLFLADGNHIKWAHKSIQDYFAAEFISNQQKKEDILEKIYKSKRSNFVNFIDLLYEIDYLTFRKILSNALLSDFIKHCDSTYKDFNEIDAAQIRERQAFTFFYNICFVKTKNDKAEINNTILGFQEMHKDYSFYTEYLSSENVEFTLLIFVQSRVFELMISKILALGSESIFENIRPSKYLSKQVLSSLSNEPIYIDDDIALSINQQSVFDGVNHILNSVGLLEQRLDYKKCLIEKKKIEKDFQNEGDLLDGI